MWIQLYDGEFFEGSNDLMTREENKNGQEIKEKWQYLRK